MKADIESPPGDPMIRVGGIAASWGVCCGPRRYLVYIPSGISLQFRAPVRIRAANPTELAQLNDPLLPDIWPLPRTNKAGATLSRLGYPPSDGRLSPASIEKHQIHACLAIVDLAPLSPPTHPLLSRTLST
ncbi:hypothetical protein SUGI_1513410 [Cryptomeria japonica]|uniref:Uncharacterized protein n=1 Tax=Cryptomeria japonica TaxID=3369 RepID=A0AAD3NUR8_CRYJA|nr:hypothetical protein SUGI_1455750 [Cryptomeria japonica]GLJ59537.1 hypothetical protein SUGI_1513410 [Cryptomeria japonica]